MTAYRELLRSPHWQRRRLERLEAAGWKCSECSDADSELHVHHERYIQGRAPWEYDDSLLTVLCDRCHTERHKIGARRPARRTSHAAAGLLDRATWLLIHRSDLWSALDGESHDLLAAQGAPYDAFFGCIERLLQEDGPLGPCATLGAISLQSSPSDAQCMAALARIAAFHTPPPDTDLAAELRRVIDLLKLQAIDEELKLLFKSTTTSPDLQRRGQFLQTERLRLKRAAA